MLSARSLIGDYRRGPPGDRPFTRTRCPSNRGLRAGLVGTPETVAERIRAFADAGLDLLLLQCSPQLEEMERFAEEVMPLVEHVGV